MADECCSRSWCFKKAFELLRSLTPGRLYARTRAPSRNGGAEKLNLEKAHRILNSDGKVCQHTRNTGQCRKDQPPEEHYFARRICNLSCFCMSTLFSADRPEIANLTRTSEIRLILRPAILLALLTTQYISCNNRGTNMRLLHTSTIK